MQITLYAYDKFAKHSVDIRLAPRRLHAVAVGAVVELERDGRGPEARPRGRRGGGGARPGPQVRRVPLAVRVVQPAVSGGRGSAVPEHCVRGAQGEAVPLRARAALQARRALVRRRRRARLLLELDRVHRLALQRCT